MGKLTSSITPQHWPPAEVLLVLLSLAFDGLHDDIKIFYSGMFLPKVIKETVTAW